jgi:hypothetical protein
MSLVDSALALEALSGDSDRQFPHGMQALREEIAANPEQYRWAIQEDARRRLEQKR